MKKSKYNNKVSLSRRAFIRRTAAGTAMIAFAPNKINTLLAENVDAKFHGQPMLRNIVST